MTTSLGRLSVALLAAVVLLQFWTLQRQGNLEQQMNNLQSRQNHVDNRVRNDVNHLKSTLNEMAQGQRWVYVQHQTLEPGANCETLQGRVGWNLQDWTNGTTSRLLFRTSQEQDWQEATVTALSGQNYVATFPVTVKPGLELGVSVDYGGQGSHRSTTESTSTERGLMNQNLQYQIVAEGTDFNRSTEQQAIHQRSYHTLPLRINVRVRANGIYTVDVFSHTSNSNPCVQLESVEVRAIAGDRAVFSTALTPKDEIRLSTDFKSDEVLSGIDVVVRYGGLEEIVPISLRQ